jgi:hypothetical protein
LSNGSTARLLCWNKILQIGGVTGQLEPLLTALKTVGPIGSFSLL